MTHEDSSEEQSAFVLVDFSIPQRQKPIIHPAVDAPLCDNCRRLELGFFDPHCPDCRDILKRPLTTIAEVFAILRQWVPQIQKNILLFIEEILKRGAHINDRDGLTDMTLLHYASKSGACGVGDSRKTEEAVKTLLKKGAAVSLFSRWTHMTALHYATYFDCASVVELLLKASKGIDVNKPCSDFDNGTPLHIAAGNLCLEAAACFLKYGANPLMKDDLDRIPLGCVPDEGMFDADSEMSISCLKMKKLLREAEESAVSIMSSPGSGGRAILQSMGIKLGDKVVVGGLKMGTLRFYGTTEFASGSWAGIELDEASGKNDGSIQGVSYFRCPDKHGIFAPINKISKLNCNQTFTSKLSRSSSFSSRHSTPTCASTNNAYRHLSWTDSSLSNSRISSPLNSGTEFLIGDRVVVGGHKKGQIVFYGETHFSPGMWYGIELDSPIGKNDGAVGDIRYFTCKPRHGIFAPPSRVKRLLETQILSASVNSLDRTPINSGKCNLLRSFTGSQSSLSSISSSGSRTRSIRKNIPSRSNSEFKLVEGMNVFVNGEIGVIRFIGSTAFGDGIWLGIELRTAKGKNDGSVQGKRYFSCKPNYGLLVRPSKVTVRGINGATLLDDA